MSKPRLRAYAGRWYPAERAERMALIDTLQVGDLIRHRGRLRVVREVHQRPKRSWMPLNQVYSVTLAIRRCSWTRRPYTVVSRFDFYLGDFEIVRRGYGADRTPLGRQLQAQLVEERGTCKRGALGCCDVAQVIA